MKTKAVFVRRVLSVAAAILVHALLVSFAGMSDKTGEPYANAAGTYSSKAYSPVMKIADIREALPQTPLSSGNPAAVSAAETVSAAEGAKPVPETGGAVSGGTNTNFGEPGDFLPSHLVSQLPRFSDEALKERIRYPPLAQRAGIEGNVYLEIFVDRDGVVRNVRVLKEEPEGRGFGGAAAAAFRGLRGTPALANGKASAVRYRYPVRFSLR